MTYYYYLASDKIFENGSSSLDLVEASFKRIPGFDYPIQFEIINGVETDWELRELLQLIHHHTKPYKVCTIQVANLLNSNRTQLKVEKKSKIQLHEIITPKQLLLQEGQLLTIKKIPTFL